MTKQHDPPDDWPVPVDFVTPEALAEVSALAEIDRRSQAMVAGMQQHWGRR